MGDRMHAGIVRLFERYERFFARGLAGDADMSEAASFYASDFVASSPAGLMTGRNDDQFKQVMAQAYAHYRAIGTKDMRIRNVDLAPIDEHHCLVHVAWTARYDRPKQADAVIDFDVHYLVRVLDGDPKIFGWMSGDEQALLRQHGIL